MSSGTSPVDRSSALLAYLYDPNSTLLIPEFDLLQIDSDSQVNRILTFLRIL